MLIIHVIAGLPKVGGTSTFCGELLNSLSSLGHDVLLVTHAPYTQEDYPLDPAIHTITISTLLHHSHTTLSHLFPSHPNQIVVHIHGLWYPFLSRAAHWAHRQNIPVVWSGHGMYCAWALKYHKIKKTVAWHLYQKRSLSHANRIHVTSTLEEQALRSLGLTNQTVYAPLGTHLQPLPNASLRTPTILFVGRIHVVKGLANLIRAWARLGTQTNGWTLRLVGPDENNYTAHLQELISHLSAQGIVFAGPRFGDALTQEYACASCLILPSFTENFGGVVIDALACGTPVVASTYTPWESLMQNQCGWWVSNEPEILAHTLAEVIQQSPDERSEMATHAQAFVQKSFSWTHVATHMLQAYQDLL